MIDDVRFAKIALACGVPLAQVPSLHAALTFSREALTTAREAAKKLSLATPDAMSVLALGSVGRMEASAASDLDLAVLYDPTQTTRGRAEQMRAELVDGLGAHFDIPQKTFRAAIDMHDLLHNVGGQRDTNTRLTYRALILTESAWLYNQAACDGLRREIFDVYADGRVTRGKVLASLANDLHRYWRTVCVDYRFKVEEQAKGWALRSLKLRHSRKLWHLSNITLQMWAASGGSPRDSIDDQIFERLRWPTLAKLGACLHDLGLAETAPSLYYAHDRFLHEISRVSVREELDALGYETRRSSAHYLSLRENARSLDAACEEVVAALWRIDRSHLIRFCLL